MELFTVAAEQTVTVNTENPSLFPLIMYMRIGEVSELYMELTATKKEMTKTAGHTANKFHLS